MLAFNVFQTLGHISWILPKPEQHKNEYAHISEVVCAQDVPVALQMGNRCFGAPMYVFAVGSSENLTVYKVSSFE